MRLVDISELDNRVGDVRNRKVEHVIDYDMHTSFGNRYRAWMGSTENEYFSIVFMAGTLTLSLQEREILLGTDIRRFGCVESIQKAMENPFAKGMRELVNKYVKEESEDDMNKITFEKIMKVLDWKFKSKSVKVEKDMVFV